MKNRLLSIVMVTLVFTTLITGCAITEGLILNSFDLTEFTVRGRQLYMDNLINSNTPKQLSEILDKHPEIEEIVMLEVEGSIDDEANLNASRLVRKNGLNTRLLKNSVVASGGTDFFLAGVERRIEKGARLGVHSWSDGYRDGCEVAKSDPQHEAYLSYYRKMGIPQSFYWYTLNAASADDIHWMTQDELVKYNIAIGTL